MAIVPENRRLFAPMTVYENLEMGVIPAPAASSKDDLARVYDLVPAADAAAQAARRDDVGRRAADGRDGARAACRSPKLPADGRALDGASRRSSSSATSRSSSRCTSPGVAILVGRAERERLAVDRRPRLRPADRPDRALGRRVDAAPGTRICERPTLAVDVASLPGRIRHRFPVFEQRVYINSCSQGALSDSVRDAYGRYLDDWDEHGAPVGVLGRAARGRRAEPSRGLINADEDEVAVTTSGLGGRERARERACASERAATRSSSATSSSRRSGRSGTRRSGAACGSSTSRPRPTGRSRSSGSRPRSTSRPRSSRSRTSASGTGAGSTSRPWRELAHERGALVLVGCLPDGRLAAGRRSARSAATSSPPASSKYLLGSAGLGFFLLPPRARRARSSRPRPAGSPTATSSRWTSTTTRPRRPRAGSRPGTPPSPADLRGDRRDRADAGDRDRGDRGARSRAERAPARRRRRARRRVGHAARAGASGALRLRPLDRRERPRRGAGGGRRRPPRHATTTCASRRIATTPPTTSRGARRASRATASC